MKGREGRREGGRERGLKRGKKREGRQKIMERDVSVVVCVT